MSPHDDFVDRMLANLKVIAMIPRGGKLCVRQGQLCLEPVDPMQRVRRWLLGDSRNVALAHVRSTVNGAIDLSNTLLQQHTLGVTAMNERTVTGANMNAGAHTHVHNGGGCQPTSTTATVVGSPPVVPLWTLQRLTREMQHCDAGFKNLRATYAHDSLLVANLEVLAERLDEHEKDVNRVLAHLALICPSPAAVAVAATVVSIIPVVPVEAASQSEKSGRGEVRIREAAKMSPIIS